MAFVSIRFQPEKLLRKLKRQQFNAVLFSKILETIHDHRRHLHALNYQPNVHVFMLQRRAIFFPSHFFVVSMIIDPTGLKYSSYEWEKKIMRRTIGEHLQADFNQFSTSLLCRFRCDSQLRLFCKLQSSGIIIIIILHGAQNRFWSELKNLYFQLAREAGEKIKCRVNVTLKRNKVRV